jgi:hypothetical protein
MKIPTIGDTVAFSSKWLKSTQAHELGRARGTVLEVSTHGGLVLVSVKWSDNRVTRVLGANLVRVEDKHLEAF